MNPDTLRTPDERFAGLEDFAFEPHYVELDGYRVHYLDEGPPEGGGPVVLLLHGEPSWCYLYRKMIPVLVEAGYRCVAPDLLGFGRSDKPVRRETYTYQFHVDLMNSFVRAVDLPREGSAMFCQDWGGLIGLRVLADQPERFSRLVVANTALPTGDHPASDGFLRWLHYSQTVERFHAGGIVKGGCVAPLSAGAIAAYNAPFPTEEFQAGARQFPVLVPITPDNPASEANRKAWEVLRQWPGKVLTLFSDKDPVMAGGERVFQKLMPGAAAGQPHEIIADAGHFLQEDKGEEIAAKMVAWMMGGGR